MKRVATTRGRWGGALLIFVMAFTYDVTTQIGQVRLLVADTDSTHAIFQDEEVQAALNLETLIVFIPITANVATPLTYNTPSIRRSAATLLDVLAANKARLASAMKVLDIDIDSTKAAKELRETATQLREVEANMGHFGIVEMVPNIFAARERWYKQILRLQSM